MGPPTEEFGPYLVYEQLGVGGMASVHRAEAVGVAGFRKAVALKRMLPSVAGDASLVQSFIREARLASVLRHANVAQTYDLGKVGDIYFIAMELVPGRNLREILKRCAAAGTPIPLAYALNILVQICDALDYAHNLTDESGAPLGIVHRDVSPANVIVSEGGTCKLIDFGIAKATAGGMQTLSGTIKGKFGYMAPEYIAGQIDARADLFALGVIGHEMLANRPLFQGKDDMDTLMRVKTMPIAPPSRHNPAVPAEIDAIVMTALERDPEQRWQRAAAMRSALTTETKRLSLIVTNQSVYDWMDRVFSAPEIDSGPIIAIEHVAAGSEPDAGEPVTTIRQSAPAPAQPAPAPALTISSGARTLPQRAATPARPPTTLSDAGEPIGDPAAPRLFHGMLVLGITATTAAVVYLALLYLT
ncbi:MAG TPA: serine/threonine-protein kinase [Kofleriaceae bacterium]|nr:serine/threonine-protein kinase [Kofleriaceae bacterium]